MIGFNQWRICDRTRKNFLHAPALLLLTAFCLTAQPTKPPAKPADPLNRDTPQSAVYSFLEACHTHNYTRALKYLDLRKLPEDRRLRDGPQLAQQLQNILDRDAKFDVAALSRNPSGSQRDPSDPNRELIDTFKSNGQNIKLTLERIKLTDSVSVWLFSSDSVERIPQLAVMLSSAPIERYLPAKLVTWKLIDTSLWRWIALALVAIVTGAIGKLLARLGLLIVFQLLLKRFAHLKQAVIDSIVGPLWLLLFVAIFRAAMVWISPSALLRLGLERVLALLFFSAIAWLCVRIIDMAIVRAHTVLAAQPHSFSYSVLPLVSRLLKITVFFFAAAAVLSNWGYNTTAILAGLGVGGIAIALAAQKTIENFFGGVAVIGDRPVSVGDFCKFGDRAGTIEDIGLRSTRIRTGDRTLVIVPNATFSSMTLENFNQRDKMLFHLTLNLVRSTTPDQMRSVLESTSKILQNPKIEPSAVPVRFTGVGAYSLDVEIASYILTTDGDEFFRLQQDLLLKILDAVAAAGTALALPTQASVIYPSEEESPVPAPRMRSNGVPGNSRN